MQRDVMYHNSPETKKQQEMFSNLLGLNDLHMKCFQEMYLDTCQALAACGSASGFSPSSSSNTSSSDTTSNNSMISPLSLSPKSSRSNSPSTYGGGTANVLSALQHQQLIAVHQQHLAAAAMAQHQMAMATATSGNPENATGTTAVTHQSPDEISKSLKMFAMLTAYSNGSDQFIPAPPQIPTPSPVDAVMQEFASNGYICDELNRYHLGMHLSNAAHLKSNTGAASGGTTSNTSLLTAAVNQHRNNGHSTTMIGGTGASSSQHQQMIQQHNINLNFNNNFWKMLPAHLQQHSNAVTAAAAAAAAATATAAANIEYNSNPKKITKRFNGTKNEKHTSATHCVFCENNNEPEEVVKSHSVRDSFGRVLCPKLRTYTCPICKASGDMAHTVKYCPQKKIITMEDAIKAESFRLAKGTYYKQQMKV